MAAPVITPRTPPTTTTGERGPEQMNATRVIVDIDKDIYWYQPKASPLTVLTGRLRNTRTVTQWTYNIMEMDEYPRTVKLTAASVIGDTTLDVEVGTGARVPKYAAMINLRTGEQVWVSGVSGDVLTVTRAAGGQHAQADMDAGDELLYSSQVFEDGASKGDLKSILEAIKTNYSEIVRTAYGTTGRGEHTDLYGGKDLPTIRKQAAIEHAKGLEYRALFGRKGYFTGPGGHIISFSGGLDESISSNVWNLENTVPTERAFLEFLEEAMKWGPNGSQNGGGSKFFFGSGRWMTEINSWAHDRLRLAPESKKLGLNIMTYDSPHGELHLVRNPLLDYKHQDRAYIVDMGTVRQVRHQGRGTSVRKNIQDNSADSVIEEVFTDGGFEVQLEGANAKIVGLKV